MSCLFSSDDPSYLPGHTILDKPPLPPIRSQQDQVIQASNHFYRSDSPQPFISNSNRPKTGHPSNNNLDGSPSGATRRRLPKISGAATLPPGAPPLYLGSTNAHPTLPKVGEEDSIEIGSFPEDIPASILDQTSNVDTLDDAVVAVIKSEDDGNIEAEDNGKEEESNGDLLPENNEVGENNNDVTNCDEIDGDKTSGLEESGKTEPFDVGEEGKSEVDISAENVEINASINVEKSESDDVINSDVDEKEENVVKPDEDEKSNHSEANENDGDQTQMPNGSLEEEQVPIEEDDDNDVMSPNEGSRETSAQSARSGVLSPLNVSPKVLSRLVTPLPTSPKSQNSRSASRLSSKINSRAPSANLHPNTYNTYNSPLKSPGSASPKMGSSSSRKSSAQISRASSRPNTSKLGKIYYVNTVRPS